MSIFVAKDGTVHVRISINAQLDKEDYAALERKLKEIRRK